MTSTTQDFFHDSTPLNKNIVRELGLMKGAVACKIIYASNLRDSVCKMGQSRIADELGIDKSTVSKTIKWLLENDYFCQLQEPTDTTPAHIKPSEKLMSLLDTVDVINPPVDNVNPPVDNVNQNKNTNKNKDKTTNGCDADFGEVCTVYENEIGLLSPMVSNKIKLLLDDYPRDWIIDAVKVAVGANVRRINYVEGILKRWATEGKNDNGRSKAIPQATTKTADGGFYL